MIREFKWVTMIIFIIIAILIRLFLVGNEIEVKETVSNDNRIQYIIIGADDYDLFYGDDIVTTNVSINDGSGENVGDNVGEVIKPIEDRVIENEKVYWLARIIHAEANGESIDGKIAVGNVVMNRVNSDEFPNTIKEVIFEKGQFSPVSNGTIYNEPSNDAIRSATMVLDGETVVEDRALFFYNAQIVSRGNWIRSRQVVEVIGNHTFCE